jgi:hypothetical protein
VKEKKGQGKEARKEVGTKVGGEEGRWEQGGGKNGKKEGGEKERKANKGIKKE